MMHGDDIVWVRSLSGYRLGVLLPKGFAFISSNVAAQLTTTGDGRLKLAFANPSGQSNPVTIHARRTSAAFPPQPATDMFFDDIKTLYDLGAPETGRDHGRADLQRLPQGREGDARLAAVPAAAGPEGDRPRHGEAADAGEGAAARHGRQARRADRRRQAERAPADHRHAEGRRLHASRTASWCSSGRCTACATPCCCRRAGTCPPCRSRATIGTYQGRAFVALINLNAENNYTVAIQRTEAELGIRDSEFRIWNLALSARR